MNLKTRPMVIQRKSIRFGLRTKCWGMLSEMGTGKTLAAIYWALKSGLRRIAVLGRPDDLDTWEEEIRTHTSAMFVNVCIPKGKLARIKRLKCKAHFTLLTYDSVKQLESQLKKIKWDGVIADEMTEIKHHKTARTKSVIKVFGRIPHRLGMTGTPITNSPLNIFSQMLFIDGGQRFGTNEWKFRNKYFWPEPSGYRWHPYNDSLKRIRKKIYEVCIRFRKSDALDLPPKVFLKKSCSMTPAQQRVYKQIRDEFELVLKNDEVFELDYAIQQFVKLLQVTGGFYYTPDGDPEDLPCGKLDNLRWMLGLDEFRETKKIVIWAAFNHELERIRDVAVKLGYHGVMFWRHTPDRKAARKRFAEDPGCQLFIGQAASGIGMNELKVSDTVIYYSRSLKLIHRMQSVDRTHRKGSEIHDRIRYFDLIVPGTVDAKVYATLRRHKSVADAIVDGQTAMDFLS